MGFNPDRLILGRRRRGLTQTRLAQQSDLDRKSIQRFESGEMAPKPDVLGRIAEALNLLPQFFHRDSAPMLSTGSFRSISSATQRQYLAALAAGSIAIDLARFLDAKLNLPRLDLPDFSELGPRGAAAALRMHWGVGNKPIKNVVHLLEGHGVRVFTLVEECREVDAFSVFMGNEAFVFLSTLKSGERGRFDACHELAHLILHRHGAKTGRLAEREANAFASEFLMPAPDVLALVPQAPALPQLLRLKSHWGVSLAALAHRVHDVGLVRDFAYKSLCIEISARGYRSAEPIGMPRETSKLLKMSFDLLKADGITRAQVADELGLHPSDLDRLMFGLVMVGIDGHAATTAPKAATKLRLVT